MVLNRIELLLDLFLLLDLHLMILPQHIAPHPLPIIGNLLHCFHRFHNFSCDVGVQLVGLVSGSLNVLYSSSYLKFSQSSQSTPEIQSTPQISIQCLNLNFSDLFSSRLANFPTSLMIASVICIFKTVLHIIIYSECTFIS